MIPAARAVAGHFGDRRGRVLVNGIRNEECWKGFLFRRSTENPLIPGALDLSPERGDLNQEPI